MDNKKLEMPHGLLQSNKNVILRICDAAKPAAIAAQAETEIKYQLPTANSSNVIQYQLLNQPQPQQQLQLQTDLKPLYVDKKLPECQIFFLNDVESAPKPTGAPQHCLISPKVEGDTVMNQALKRSYLMEPAKRRDDKRRATHNEVERRRRDKINSWIFKLKELIPESEPDSPQPEGRAKASSGDSKSQILIKACDYIKFMQDEIDTFRKCLTENETLRLQNEQLQQENADLRAKLKLSLDEEDN